MRVRIYSKTTRNAASAIFIIPTVRWRFSCSRLRSTIRRTAGVFCFSMSAGMPSGNHLRRRPHPRKRRGGVSKGWAVATSAVAPRDNGLLELQAQQVEVL